MEFKSFHELIQRVQTQESKKRVAVVAAQDEHTLEAVFRAKKDNIVEPILIGNKTKIKEIITHLGEEVEEIAIVDVEDDTKAARKAVEFIHENNADFIMKGKIQTADLLRAVVDKEKGLRTPPMLE